MGYVIDLFKATSLRADFLSAVAFSKRLLD